MYAINTEVAIRDGGWCQNGPCDAKGKVVGHTVAYLVERDGLIYTVTEGQIREEITEENRRLYS